MCPRYLTVFEQFKETRLCSFYAKGEIQVSAFGRNLAWFLPKAKGEEPTYAEHSAGMPARDW